MKQFFIKSYNGYLDETVLHLIVILTGDKGPKRFKVAWLVHQAFGKPERDRKNKKPSSLPETEIP